ncbi:MAG: hypothetical protein ABF633_17045 [Clostridium sp.]
MDTNSTDQSMAGSDKIITWFKAGATGEVKEVKKDYVKNNI